MNDTASPSSSTLHDTPGSPPDAGSDPSALDADVVVIGFGPVGATAAGLLARRGRRVVVLDRDVDLFPLPRAAHVDAEAMRILQEIGCGEEMRDSLRANPGMDFLTADHQVLISMRSGTSTPFGWHSSNFMFQPDFERRLRAAVQRNGADIRLGVEATAIEQSDDHVVVHLADGTSLRSHYVIGCDGARSSTRRAIGATMHDLEFEEPWLVVDLVLEPGAVERSSLPDHALQVCDPDRPHTLVPMPEPRFRFEFMLLPGETADDMQRPEKVHDLLAPWLPREDAVVERSAVYTFHGLVAHQWRDRRVLLAGDAVHQTPPFLGQGMCSGMRDAANLAWKLDAVLDGAAESLLDTYQTERDPHVRSIIEAAVAFGRIICTTDHEMAAGRDAAMLAARDSSAEPTDGDGIPLPPLVGPLVGVDGGRPSRQPRVDGMLLDEIVGLGWSVITRTEEQAAAAAASWAALAPVTLSAERHPELSEILDGAECVVVRPDRYEYGRGHASELAPPALLVR